MRHRLTKVCCSILTCSVIQISLMAVFAWATAAQSTLSTHLKDVVSHYAPIIIAETYGSPDAPIEAWDHILPVDLDGDLLARNNYSNAVNGQITDGRPTVYFSIVETGTRAERGYYFINYYFYHPYDAGVSFVGAVKGKGRHENDLEGVMLLVKKTWYSPYGELVAALTQSHGANIPWKNPSTTVPVYPVGLFWIGYVRFWHEETFNVDRAVVAIRSRKHGTYMAQDCSGQTQTSDPGFGMWLGSPEQQGAYVSCIHADGNAMIYVPVPLDVSPTSGIGAVRLGPNVNDGTHWYRLAEVVDSPLWTQRAVSGGIFFNQYVYLDGSDYAAYDSFAPSDPIEALTSEHMAHPPWQWRGGPGECILDHCWYTFGYDNTLAAYSPMSWPQSPPTGLFMVNPAAEAAIRFIDLPELNEPTRYNPYLAPPPVCCTDYPLSAKVDGPDIVQAGTTNQWTAVGIGGTPPYTYQWSGAFRGTAQTISGSTNSDVILYLDLYDNAGHHVAVSKAVELPPVTVRVDGPVYIDGAGTYGWGASASGGTGVFTYQWQKKSDGSSVWYNVGTNSRNYSEYEDVDQTFYLRVIATSAGSSATSSQFKVTVSLECTAGEKC